MKVIGIVIDVEEGQNFYKLRVGDGLSGGVTAFVWRRDEYAEVLRVMSGSIDL